MSGYTTRFLWTPRRTEVFLDLWQEYILELRGMRLNTHIYQEMAEKMSQFVNIKPVEIKAKIDNMTKKYRTELSRCSDKKTSEWIYFKQVEKILLESLPLKADLLMANSLDYSPFEDSDACDSDHKDNEIDKGIAEVPGSECSPVKAERLISPNDSPGSDQNEFLPIKSSRAREMSSVSDGNKLTPIKARRRRAESPDLFQSKCVSIGTSRAQKKSSRHSKHGSDSAFSVKTFRPALLDNNKMERLLAIEEKKLAIQKEELRALKKMADGLSSVHRNILKVYQYNSRNKPLEQFF